MLNEANTYSNLIEDLTAENKTLRQMHNIPDNYGIQIEQIKLHDKEKISDFKRLIQELQNDNFKLEEERALLKNRIRHQSMMYKDSGDERYKGLSEDQLIKVDNFALRLINNEAIDEVEFHKIKKENEMLKEKMEAVNVSNVHGLAMFEQKVKNLEKGIKTGGQGLGEPEDPARQLTQLVEDNKELHKMVKELL